MIPVTKPFLPPIDDYIEYLKQIWDRNWLTNNGPLVNELELKLKEYLGIDYLLYLNNGTAALQFAIRVLNLKGEIITTPFSYIATTSSIAWEGCEPVFVDIHPETFNIDPSKIEAAITSKTSGIIATHTYGNPCDVEAIQVIAEKYGLRVIYDGAHCFGTSFKGKSIFSYGDISTTSFHATKLFHSIEGGGIFTGDGDLLKKMAYMRNFGHNGTEDFSGVGINGKNSEFHAAMGLINLNHINKNISKRKQHFEKYREWLKYIRGRTIIITPGTVFNYAYFPLVFESEAALIKAQELLNANWIFPRRYFYPSLNTLQYVTKKELPVCDVECRKVLCLPLYESLSTEEIDYISRLILRAQNN
jgi:dTDP-4-amino-4,6-dideoxygalactose transaminase